MVEGLFQVPPDSSGAKIRTISQTISGNTVHTQQIGYGKNPTYSVLAQDVVVKSGGTLLSIWHVSGTPAVNLQGLSVVNTTTDLLSGQSLQLDLIYPSAVPTGGTNLSAIPYDRVDPESGVRLTIMSSPTNVFSGDRLKTVATIPNQIRDPYNIFFSQPDINEIALRSGRGFAIQQRVSGTGYVQVTSGVFSVNLVYSVEY